MSPRHASGYARSKWVAADRARNEALDWVYAYAAAMYADVSRANWEWLERSLASQTTPATTTLSKQTSRRPYIDQDPDRLQ